MKSGMYFSYLVLVVIEFHRGVWGNEMVTNMYLGSRQICLKGP
jgi:hypothetical protein